MAIPLSGLPRLYRLLSRLLDYPDQELADYLQAGDALKELPESAHRVLAVFREWALGQDLLAWQAQYVRTFDLNPDHSLHLTWHLFEEQDRRRGLTLANLAEFYQRQGLEIKRGELPDYLPLILEYASTLPSDQGGTFLAQCQQALEVLAANLYKVESPYAPLVRLLIARLTAEDAREPQNLLIE
ncbi:hypothetical protein JCM13664_03650 [Methylothermus subterraneus]